MEDILQKPLYAATEADGRWAPAYRREGIQPGAGGPAILQGSKRASTAYKVAGSLKKESGPADDRSLDCEAQAVRDLQITMPLSFELK
jgi:hypothetical protein